MAQTTDTAKATSAKKPVRGVAKTSVVKTKRGKREDNVVSIRGGKPVIHDDTVEKQNNAGQPRAFESEEKFIELFTWYIEDVVAKGYDRLPTQTDFCRWLKPQGIDVNVRTVHRTITEYCPSVKRDMVTLISDTIATGGAMSKYRDAMAIFALKNWCGWADKQESIITNVGSAVEGMSMDDKMKRLQELREKQGSINAAAGIINADI